MKVRKIIRLFVVVIICSCFQQTSKSERQIENSFNHQHELKNALQIENGINSGLTFTDSLGDKYAITYIAITVANDNFVPIKFQIALSSEYNHPLAENGEKFKLILLPKEWTFDGVTISDSLINEIPNYSGKRIISEILKPGEKSVFGIGSLRPSPAKICVVIPNSLFANDLSGIYPECDWKIQEQYSTNSQIDLWLKLDYCHKDGNAANCTIISCGQISYPKN